MRSANVESAPAVLTESRVTQRIHWEDEMQKGTAVGETLIAKTASEGVVLTVLSHLKNGKTEEALAGFAEKFRFEDHGMGLSLKTSSSWLNSRLSKLGFEN
jgi:hypothetical protein